MGVFSFSSLCTKYYSEVLEVFEMLSSTPSRQALLLKKNFDNNSQFIIPFEIIDFVGVSNSYACVAL